MTKVQNIPNRLALDAATTQDLRAQLRKDPEGGLQAAAQQFEAMFLQMVLKSMRDATPQDGLLDSDASRFYTSMLDQQLAQNMSSGKGLGLARLIEQQLGRNQGTVTTGVESGAVAGDGKSAAAAISAGNSLALRQSDARHLPAVPAPQTLPAATAPAASGATETGNGFSSTKDFVSQVWPHAVEASRSTGIPPQFLVAHAALESGWGKNDLRGSDGTPTFNLFGIKAGKNWTGATVDAITTEYVDGTPQRVTERFRAYGSYGEAFRDYASLLRNNPRYGNVVGSQDGTEFAKRLQQAGYATDPMYADKLSRIISGPTLRQALIG